MFESVMDSIGDSLDSLFTLDNIGKATGKALSQASSQGASYSSNQLLSLASSGNREISTTNQVTERQGDPAQAVDYQAVEAAWVARLAKFAGIANATAVKLG